MVRSCRQPIMPSAKPTCSLRTTSMPRSTSATRCVTVDVNRSERDALVVRGYLPWEERDNGAAIKKAIEGVISDMAFELQSETAENDRSHVWSVDPRKHVTVGGPLHGCGRDDCRLRYFGPVEGMPPWIALYYIRVYVHHASGLSIFSRTGKTS
jgi:hypothetical protein